MSAARKPSDKLKAAAPSASAAASPAKAGASAQELRQYMAVVSKLPHEMLETTKTRLRAILVEPTETELETDEAKVVRNSLNNVLLALVQLYPKALENDELHILVLEGKPHQHLAILENALNLLNEFKVTLTDTQVTRVLEFCDMEGKANLFGFADAKQSGAAVRNRPTIELFRDVLNKLKKCGQLNQANINKLIIQAGPGELFNKIMAADFANVEGIIQGTYSNTAAMLAVMGGAKTAAAADVKAVDKTFKIANTGFIASRTSNNNFTLTVIDQGLTLALDAKDFDALNEAITVTTDELVNLPSLALNKIFGDAVKQTIALDLIKFHKLLAQIDKSESRLETLDAYERMVKAQGSEQSAPPAQKKSDCTLM